MPILDFNEIASAKADKAKPGIQDTFELFARDLLEHIGFKIISPPNRGADQGKDIVIEETRRGVGGETQVRWLVSCKHFAPSGVSVKPEDEINIIERAETHKCHGFLGFYSTIPSTGLGAFLDGIKGKIETQVYDRERIEKSILGSAEGTIIAKRYFPISMEKWASSQPKPADVMIAIKPLKCDYTGEDLLSPVPRGIIALVYDYDTNTGRKNFHDIYWYLKGKPDEILENYYHKKGLMTSWEDISDITIPLIYIKWYMSLLNELRSGETYSDIAFSKIKQFLITLYPFISRSINEEERAQIKALMTIPSPMGGLG